MLTNFIVSFNSSLNGCSLEQEGEDFFIVGADSVRKKLGGNEVVLLGTVTSGQSVNVKDILPNYAELTKDNFIISPTAMDAVYSCYWHNSVYTLDTSASASISLQLSYDSINGIVKIPSLSCTASAGSGTAASGTLINVRLFYIGGYSSVD